MRRPFLFDHGQPFIPSRAWADAWKPAVMEYWRLVLSDYRSRVNDHYSRQAELQPDAFPLASPTEVRIVVSLARCWIFTKPADEDCVWIDEQWEHEVLASPDIFHHPDHESAVRGVLQIGPEWTMRGFEETGSLWFSTESEAKPGGNPFKYKARVPGHIEGYNLADSDETFRNRVPDFEALQRARQRLQELEAFDDHQERGRQFDRLVENVLRAHGCSVVRGRFREGEQIDVFVHRPFRALVLCRWAADPIGNDAVGELYLKLTRERPPIVFGIYVSMSGFTAPAITEAASRSHERTMMLFDRQDFESLLGGDVDIKSLIEDKLDEIVLRYHTD